MVVGETHHSRNPPHDGHLKITCDSHGKPLDGFPRIVCVLKAHLQGDGRGGYLWESMAYGRLSFRVIAFFCLFLKYLEIPSCDFILMRNFSEIHSITSSWSWDPTPQQKYVLKRVDSFFFLGRQGRSFESTDLHGWIRWSNRRCWSRRNNVSKSKSSWKVCFPWQYSSIHYYKPLISPKKKSCPLAVHEENSRQRLHWPPTKCIGHQQELKVETSRAVQLISKVG